MNVGCRISHHTVLKGYKLWVSNQSSHSTVYLELLNFSRLLLISGLEYYLLALTLFVQTFSLQTHVIGKSALEAQVGSFLMIMLGLLLQGIVYTQINTSCHAKSQTY